MADGQQQNRDPYFDALDQRMKQTVDGVDLVMDPNLKQWTYTDADGSRMAMTPQGWQPTSPAPGFISQLGSTALGQPASAGFKMMPWRQQIQQELPYLKDPFLYGPEVYNAVKGGLSFLFNPNAQKERAQAIAAQRTAESPQDTNLNWIEQNLAKLPWVGEPATATEEYARRRNLPAALGSGLNTYLAARSGPEFAGRAVMGPALRMAQGGMGIGKVALETAAEHYQKYADEAQGFQIGQAANREADRHAGDLGGTLPKLANDIKEDYGRAFPTVGTVIPSENVWARMMQNLPRGISYPRLPSVLQDALDYFDPVKNHAVLGVSQEAQDILSAGNTAGETVVELIRRGYSPSQANGMVKVLARGGRMSPVGPTVGRIWNTEYNDLKYFSNRLGQAMSTANPYEQAALKSVRDEIENMRDELAGNDTPSKLQQHLLAKNRYELQQKYFREPGPLADVLNQKQPGTNVPQTNLERLYTDEVRNRLTDPGNYNAVKAVLEHYVKQGRTDAADILRSLNEMKKTHDIFRKAPQQMPAPPVAQPPYTQGFDPRAFRERTLSGVGHPGGIVGFGPFMRYAIERALQRTAARLPGIHQWLLANPSPWNPITAPVLGRATVANLGNSQNP